MTIDEYVKSYERNKVISFFATDLLIDLLSYIEYKGGFTINIDEFYEAANICRKKFDAIRTVIGVHLPESYWNYFYHVNAIAVRKMMFTHEFNRVGTKIYINMWEDEEENLPTKDFFIYMFDEFSYFRRLMNRTDRPESRFQLIGAQYIFDENQIISCFKSIENKSFEHYEAKNRCLIYAKNKHINDFINK